MKTHPSTVPARSVREKGSALLTVVMLTGVMAILSASMLKYSATERRGNERNKIILRSKNMAENIAVYAAEQLTTKLYRLGSAPVMSFPWTGTSRNRVYLPPDAVLNTGFTDAATGMEVRAGIEAATPYTLVNDPNDPNNGLQVSTATIPIIAKATATSPSVGSYVAHVQQDMQLALTPLFQFGMFYNMDMELYPSQPFSVTGPVHTNGNLIAHPDGAQTIAITFWNRVTAAGGVYWTTAMKAKPRTNMGGENLPTEGNGDIYFTHTNGTTQVTMKETSKWRDHRYKTATETASTLSQFKTFATNTYNGNLRTSVHGVTKLELPGIGSYSETDDPSTNDVDERDNGRQLIEPPNPKKWNTFANPGVWSVVADTADTKESKISRKAGLYIVVNPSAGRVTPTDGLPRSATLPDESVVWVMPRSYRAWLNTIQTNGTNTLTEVILPGQPGYGHNIGADLIAGNADDFMYKNNLPNRYEANTITGPGTGNQVLRIPRSDYAKVKTWNGTAWVNTDATTLPNESGYAPTGGAGAVFPADDLGTPGTNGINYTPADAFFYDLRRADGNRGVVSTSGTTALYDRATVNYVPRPIAKIDFDMTRFRMMVDRTYSSATTSLTYDVRAPSGSAVWGNSIFNTAATRANFTLGVPVLVPLFPSSPLLQTQQDPYHMYYAPANPSTAATQTAIGTNPMVYEVGATALYDASNPCAWYDGVAVYLHSVDAEMRAQSGGIPIRTDSGVRLWNGRGPIISLGTATKTGCTFVTNDAVYIIGHYNADGNINSTPTATGAGGYSAKWPDVGGTEKLCAVMGDAFIALSQPVWTSAASGQTGGWNDALSALPVGTNSVNWRTGASSSSPLNGGDDGVHITTTTNGPLPATLPNNSFPGTLGTRDDTKLPATVSSEISTALLMGLVPSNVNAAGQSDNPPYAAANGVQSGGANNFPRLNDNWNGNGLYIRGSIVGLFESRVAMEPFTNSRNYRAPGRFWGLHNDFSTANHDIPLEPIVLSSTRIGFRELTPTEYATKKALIEAL